MRRLREIDGVEFLIAALRVGSPVGSLQRLAVYQMPAEARHPQYPTYWGVSGKADFLNLRSGPTADSQVLRELLPGTVVRNLGCKRSAGQTWCEIEALDGDRIRGWGSAAYLEKPNAGLRAGQGAFQMRPAKSRALSLPDSLWASAISASLAMVEARPPSP